MSSDIFLFEAIFTDFLPLFCKNLLHTKILIFQLFLVFSASELEKWTLDTLKQLILHVQTLFVPFIVLKYYKLT